ncbi:MAG: MBL fold metallo-hydrolase [Anaerolineae bacterium]|nr:MAG: MBL fold metallo-hydrolase [Anaerolineae bacterium]
MSNVLDIGESSVIFFASFFDGEMMIIQHERVADNVYFFQSLQYAQVTAGVIAGPDMAVVIDTLAFPEETAEIRNFIDNELQVPVRYVINTHYHADHSWGNYQFPEAKVIGHTLCHEQLRTRGIPALEAQRDQNPIYRNVEIVLPHITFDEGEMNLQVGKKTLRLFPFFGHSKDSIAILVEEDRVLFSGDTVMSLPVIVDGDLDENLASLKRLPKMGLENIVQGHGDIILRGEIDDKIREDIEYLTEIKKAVKKANRRRYPLDLLEETTIEECGKARVLLGGLAPALHRQNLIGHYRNSYGETPLGSEEYYEDR